MVTKTSETQDTCFGYIQKSDITRIAVSIKTYEKHTFIDFREEYLDDTDAWKPTKKGFTIATEISVLEELRNLVDKVIEHLETN